jgi:hypothetical protein
VFLADDLLLARQRPVAGTLRQQQG